MIDSHDWRARSEFAALRRYPTARIGAARFVDSALIKTRPQQRLQPEALCSRASAVEARYLKPIENVWLEPADSAGRVGRGPLRNRIVILPDVISKEECELLMRAAAESVDDRALGEPLRRMRVRLMHAAARELSTTIIRRRVLPMMERMVPDVAEWLLSRQNDRVPFWASSRRSRSRPFVSSGDERRERLRSTTTIFTASGPQRQGRAQWSATAAGAARERQESGRHAPNADARVAASVAGPLGPTTALRIVFPEAEPAVNVYCSGGNFPLHDDGYDMSIVINLSPPGAFEGGGTQYWREMDDDKWQQNGTQTREPTLVQPPQGSALIFNGNITHAGRATTRGTRHVFVSSFDLWPVAAEETDGEY